MKNLRTLFTLMLLTGFALSAKAQCTASISSDPESICAGESVTLTVSFDTSDNDCDCNGNQLDNAAFTWTYNNQSFLGQGPSLNISSLTTTTTVSVTVNANCLDDPIQAEITITVNQPPSFSIELSNSSEALCVGNELTFELNGTFPSPVDTYDWSGVDSNNGLTATENNASAGTLNVECEVTDENGCSASANASFTVSSAMITITQSGNGSYCQGDQFTISAAPNGTPSFESCDWQVLDTGFSPSGDNCSVNIPSASTTTHNGNWQVSVVDVNGCTAVGTSLVTVNDIPDASISLATDEVCTDGGSVSISVNTANGVYSLDSNCDSAGNNPINAIGGLFNPNISGPGTFCVCYTVQEDGCEAQECAEITVNALPNVSFTSNPAATCVSGPTVNLGSFVSPPPSQGMGGSFLVNGCYETTTLNPNEPCLTGLNSLVYTFTDNNGCVNSANSNIIIYPELTAEAINDIDVCVGADAVLGVSQAGGDPNTYEYAWSPAGNLNNSSLQNPTVISASETQEYTVTVSDINGCEATSSTLLSVFAQPVISSVIQNPINFCDGGNVELCIENNWSENQWDVSVAYSWVYVNDLGEITTEGTSLPCNEIGPIAGTTPVNIDVDFSGQGCESATFNFTLIPVPDPAPVLLSTQSSLCSGEEALFTTTNTTNGSSFEWDFNPPPSSLEVIGNGNVAIASWEGQSGVVDVTLSESLVNCFGESTLSVTLNSAIAPENADIAQLGNSTLVYTDSGPDCYRWGYIDEDGGIVYLVNPITNEPETYQTVVLNQINAGYIYFCEAWFGDCSNADCSTTAVYDGAFVSVSETNSESAFTVYPNPSSGQLWLKLEQPTSPDLRVDVSNAIGQVVYTTQLNELQGSQLILLDLAGIASDIYLVSLYDKSRIIGTTRIIIHR